MKIEKITDNKIRIILNFEEFEENDIDFLSITQNAEIAKKAFKKILKKVEKEIDFRFEDSKMLIEAYVSIEGFFIITFTKLEEKDYSGGKTSKIKNKGIAKRKCYIYKFENFDDYCDWCTYINNLNKVYQGLFNKPVSLYEYSKKYYLILSNLSKEEIQIFNNYISEFAKSINNVPKLDIKIKEYGRSILKNKSIEKGIKYFCK